MAKVESLKPLFLLILTFNPPMKKGLLLLIFSLFAFRSATFAQSGLTRGCAINALYSGDSTNMEFPGSTEFERWLKRAQEMEEEKAVTDDNELYYIPVVIHILHFGEEIGVERNLSASRIQSQLDILNNDFGRLPGTPGFNTNPAGADTRIRFCLAAVDPNGQPTSGIVRVQGTKPSYDFLGDNALIKNSSIWNPDKYLNIWTCKIAGDQYIGYAQYPFITDSISMPLPIPDVLPDGVVIDYRVFGDVPAGSSGPFTAYNKGRTVTHEVGHYLGLIHIWGDGLSCTDNATDYCSDTPPQASYTSGCPASVSSCTSGVPAMFQNYMDYTNDACMNVYTNDQKRRMRIVMRNAPRRKTLFTVPTQCGISSVADPEKSTAWIQLYPNPALDVLNLDGVVGVSGTVKIIRSDGRVFSAPTTIQNDKIQVNVSNLKSGIYWIEQAGQNGKIARGKFVKF